MTAGDNGRKAGRGNGSSKDYGNTDLVLGQDDAISSSLSRIRSEANARPLPKRFYDVAGVNPSGTRWRIELDGRPARTPGRRDLALPTERLAQAIASEWQAQLHLIDPASMPLTRLANTALDGVVGREGEIAADIVKYSGSDLLCYRAERPEGLIRRQAELWDPVLAWAERRTGATFRRQTGLMPVAQAPETGPRVALALVGLDAFRLTALHTLTTLTGSALLGLAVLEGWLTAEAAWTAAHVDDDWQTAQWGEDAEAAARRAKRWQEMAAAAHLLALLEAPGC